LDEENKELGLMNTNIGAVVKLNNINRNELCRVDKLICSQCEHVSKKNEGFS
jgi:L-serine deaminase